MTRRYQEAPGVVRLRAGEHEKRSERKRVSHWLTVQLVKPRKPKPAIVEQRALF